MPDPRLTLRPAPENLLKEQARQRFDSACSDMLWSLVNKYPKIPGEISWDAMRREFQARMWELFDSYDDWRRL